MEERIILSLIMVGALIGVPALAAEPPPPNAIAVIQLQPDDKEAAAELLSWELMKIGSTGTKTEIQVPLGSELETTLRAKLKEADPETEKKPQSPLNVSDLRKILEQAPELELEDSHRLLGFLRLQAAGRTLDDPKTKEFLKQASLGEIGKVATQSAKGRIAVPEPLQKPLASALKRAIEKSGLPVPEEKVLLERLTQPDALSLAVAELDPATVKLEDLAELAGSARAQGRKLRGSRFAEDVREEARDLLASLRKAQPVDPLAPPRPQPFPSFQQPPVLNQGKPAAPPVRVQRNRGFGGRSPFSGSHQKGAVAPSRRPGPSGRIAGSPGTNSVAIRGAIPSSTSIDPAEESRLNQRKSQGHVSLQMRTVYDNNYSVMSACQITAVTEPRRIPNEENRCSYNLATARHCIEKNGRPFTDIAISPFENMVVTRAQADNLGSGDLAMLGVEAQCIRVPVAPLALDSPRGGEGILVHANIPLKGQAETNAISNNLMMMNTNHPENGGINVIQGNSGGAVTNSRGELVGVISSVMMQGKRQVPGIGFFATRDSLEFANKFVNPKFETQILGSTGSLPEVNLSQASQTHD